MIPFIRSLSELMAITDSRDSKKHVSQHNESYGSTVDSGQRKRYIKSLNKKDAVSYTHLTLPTSDLV